MAITSSYSRNNGAALHHELHARVCHHQQPESLEHEIDDTKRKGLLEVACKDEPQVS